jgi:hypothetical protein
VFQFVHLSRHCRAAFAAAAVALAVLLTGCADHDAGLVRLRSGQCRAGRPLAGVYLPSRLHVLRNCLTVSGTVACTRHEPDGDVHVLVTLARRDQRFLRPANALQHCPGASHTGRLLVVEIIPQDGGFPVVDNSADLGGFVTPAAPHAGDHIRVTGPYVLDTNRLHDLLVPGARNWAEIHPAWNITVQRHA